MTIRRAAEEYGIPRSTLVYRASGRVIPGTKSGAPTYLSPEEEEDLVQFLIGNTEIGYPKSVWEVWALVGAILSRNADSDVSCVSTGWWECFKQNHPNPSLHQGESLAYKRVIATNRDVIDKYFDLLEATISKKLMILETNHRVYIQLWWKCNAAGFSTWKKGSKKGAKHVLTYGTNWHKNANYHSCLHKCSWLCYPLSRHLQVQKLGQALNGGRSWRNHAWFKSIWMDGWGDFLRLVGTTFSSLCSGLLTILCFCWWMDTRPTIWQIWYVQRPVREWFYLVSHQTIITLPNLWIRKFHAFMPSRSTEMMS